MSELAAKPSLARDYARFVRWRVLALAAVLLAVAAAFVLDLGTGPSQLGLRDVILGLIEPARLPRGAQVILYDVRLPAAVMAVLVGASLGLAGGEMQTLLNNPLASPFTLGVSQSAALGASVAIVFHFDPFGIGDLYMIPASAFLFALGAIALVQVLARGYGAGVDSVVLFGIALFFAAEALLWLMQYLADADALQQIVFWTMGSLARATWPKIAVVATVLVICLPLALRLAWGLTLLRGGDEHAKSLGVSVERLRLACLLKVSLLAATAVCFVGTIGFVGLVGPHIARLLLGEDHRFYLPGSAAAGALVLSLASTASKAIVPGVVLPIGIVTALIGIPLFVALVLSRRRGL